MCMFSSFDHWSILKKIIFFDNFAITCDFEDQKAILFQKMHFLARKLRFFQKLILFKIDQWPKLHNMHRPKNTFSK